MARCTIEQAYNDGKIDFKKPISCHLFPIRIKEYRDFDAVNYEAINICKPACDCGEQLQVQFIVFKRAAYSAVWGRVVCKLIEAARLLKKNRQKNKIKAFFPFL